MFEPETLAGAGEARLHFIEPVHNVIVCAELGDGADIIGRIENGSPALESFQQKPSQITTGVDTGLLEVRHALRKKFGGGALAERQRGREGDALGRVPNGQIARDLVGLSVGFDGLIEPGQNGTEMAAVPFGGLTVGVYL